MGTVISFVIDVKMNDEWKLVELDTDDEYAFFPGRQHDFGEAINVELCQIFRRLEGKWWRSFDIYDRNKKGSMPIVRGVPEDFDPAGKYAVEFNCPFWIRLDKALSFLIKKKNKYLLEREHFQMYESLADTFAKAGYSADKVRLVGYWC